MRDLCPNVNNIKTPPHRPYLLNENNMPTRAVRRSAARTALNVSDTALQSQNPLQTEDIIAASDEDESARGIPMCPP